MDKTRVSLAAGTRQWSACVQRLCASPYLGEPVARKRTRSARERMRASPVQHREPNGQRSRARRRARQAGTPPKILFASIASRNGASAPPVISQYRPAPCVPPSARGRTAGGHCAGGLLACRLMAARDSSFPRFGWCGGGWCRDGSLALPIGLTRRHLPRSLPLPLFLPRDPQDLMQGFGCGSRGQSRGRRLRRWHLLRGWRWRLQCAWSLCDVRLQLVVAVVEEAHARVKARTRAAPFRAVLATTLD